MTVNLNVLFAYLYMQAVHNCDVHPDCGIGTAFEDVQEK